MAIAAQGAKQMGMEPYYLYRQKNMSGNFENVGYAKPGKAGIYNILIMEEVQTIMALGAGTISKRVYGDGRIAVSYTHLDVYKRQADCRRGYFFPVSADARACDFEKCDPTVGNDGLQ